MISPTFRSTAITAAFAATFAGAAHAQDDVATLFETMGLPDLLEIMHEEGVVYGAEIGAGLFQGNPSDAWAASVATIYDVDKMRQNVLSGLTKELEGDDVAAMQAFFGLPSCRWLMKHLATNWSANLSTPTIS